MKHKKRIAITFLIVAAGCVVGMFYFSNQNGDRSNGISEDIVLHILNLLSISPDSSIKVMDLANFVIRKLAHFSEYTVLGIGLCGLMRVLVKRYWGIAAIVLGAVLASLDEFHQLFIPGRSAMVSDVVIDTCGVVVGSIIFTLIILLQEKKRWSSKK